MSTVYWITKGMKRHKNTIHIQIKWAHFGCKNIQLNILSYGSQTRQASKVKLQYLENRSGQTPT